METVIEVKNLKRDYVTYNAQGVVGHFLLGQLQRIPAAGVGVGDHRRLILGLLGFLVLSRHISHLFHFFSRTHAH